MAVECGAALAGHMLQHADNAGSFETRKASLTQICHALGIRRQGPVANRTARPFQPQVQAGCAIGIYPNADQHVPDNLVVQVTGFQGVNGIILPKPAIKRQGG
jgi:hypothetical protein